MTALVALVALVSSVVPAFRPPPPLGGVWRALRVCESGDRYGLRSPGEPDGGAYQFDPRTWVALVDAQTRASYPTAADAPSWVQDWWAYHLWLAEGRRPWPVCATEVGL